MTRDEVISALKSNWYFVAALVAMVPAGVMVAMKDGAEAAAQSAQRETASQVAVAESIRESVAGVTFKSGETPRDGALKKIAEYESFVAQNWNSDETPVYLRRIANLSYGSVQDYQKAIENYELIIYRFPDWQGINDVYPNLAAAYQKKGQYAMERQTYRRMLEHYPAHSKHVEFAKDKLTNSR